MLGMQEADFQDELNSVWALVTLASQRPEWRLPGVRVQRPEVVQHRSLPKSLIWCYFIATSILCEVTFLHRPDSDADGIPEID
jgi:hypothetical protein